MLVPKTSNIPAENLDNGPFVFGIIDWNNPKKTPTALKKVNVGIISTCKYPEKYQIEPMIPKIAPVRSPEQVAHKYFLRIFNV